MIAGFADFGVDRTVSAIGYTSRGVERACVCALDFAARVKLGKERVAGCCGLRKLCAVADFFAVDDAVTAACAGHTAAIVDCAVLVAGHVARGIFAVPFGALGTRLGELDRVA